MALDGAVGQLDTQSRGLRRPGDAAQSPASTSSCASALGHVHSAPNPHRGGDLPRHLQGNDWPSWDDCPADTPDWMYHSDAYASPMPSCSNNVVDLLESLQRRNMADELDLANSMSCLLLRSCSRTKYQEAQDTHNEFEDLVSPASSSSSSSSSSASASAPWRRQATSSALPTASRGAWDGNAFRSCSIQTQKLVDVPATASAVPAVSKNLGSTINGQTRTDSRNGKEVAAWMSFFDY